MGTFKIQFTVPVYHKYLTACVLMASFPVLLSHVLMGYVFSGLLWYGKV
jgi:hypothetical protein